MVSAHWCVKLVPELVLALWSAEPGPRVGMSACWWVGLECSGSWGWCLLTSGQR